MSLYDDLGVDPDADIEQINAAYRKRARKAHPDAGGDPAAFVSLQRAVAILRDPERRARYDATGDDSDQPDNSHAAAVEMLISAFQEAIAAAQDLARFDVIKQTRAVLAGRLSNLAGNRTNALAEQRKFAKAIQRLGFEGDGANVLRNLLESQADAIGKALANMDRVEASIRTATEMAGSYSWEVDASPMQAMWTTTTTSATGW